MNTGVLGLVHAVGAVNDRCGRHKRTHRIAVHNTNGATRTPKVEQLNTSVAKARYRKTIATRQTAHTTLQLGQIILVQLFVHVPHTYIVSVTGTHQHLVGLVPLDNQARLYSRLSHRVEGRERRDQLRLLQIVQVGLEKLDGQVVTARQNNGLMLRVYELEGAYDGRLATARERQQFCPIDAVVHGHVVLDVGNKYLLVVRIELDVDGIGLVLNLKQLFHLGRLAPLAGLLVELFARVQVDVSIDGQWLVAVGSVRGQQRSEKVVGRPGDQACVQVSIVCVAGGRRRFGHFFQVLKFVDQVMIHSEDSLGQCGALRVRVALHFEQGGYCFGEHDLCLLATIGRLTAEPIDVAVQRHNQLLAHQKHTIVAFDERADYFALFAVSGVNISAERKDSSGAHLGRRIHDQLFEQQMGIIAHSLPPCLRILEPTQAQTNADPFAEQRVRIVT
ncbi:hypothetical protein BpHYR1_009356 [Brachionus plicatilis]|uniref:Uncharacterized protein n=1 Tax=Brachionus plicatilis TaxID=10195 RepID=A0A3M7RKZ3_BRAPC|nr:hypothetical protein BpHYR1_009356 [Brachionus plicatilis]